MDSHVALVAFDALSQETRLEVFRLLVKKGQTGAAAGTISESLNVPHNTLSFHLNHMSNAGLVVSRREGRSIIYSANYQFISGLLRFLVEDCCGEQIASIRTDKRRDCSVIEISNCCAPAESTKTKLGGKRK
jgi:ArsR family transcriptional regulator, arsenate/arsenite/antimonite-responsive transcriptional repressor